MAIRTQPPLPRRLEAVMARLCYGVKLNKTQAVKLPYLVDVLATHHLGRPITEGRHEAWDHGVVTKQAWKHLDKCDPTYSAFRLRPLPNSEETRVTIAAATAKSLAAQLTDDELAIVDYVRDTFGSIPAGELGRVTKLMNPEIPRWGGTGANLPADTSADAYERSTPEYLAMARRAAALTDDDLLNNSVLVLRLEDAIA
jgi:uncharacterized phage-associated protein